jgi:hypothetical protein
MQEDKIEGVAERASRRGDLRSLADIVTYTHSEADRLHMSFLAYLLSMAETEARRISGGLQPTPPD